jgi:hypothetical protein
LYTVPHPFQILGEAFGEQDLILSVQRRYWPLRENLSAFGAK